MPVHLICSMHSPLASSSSRDITSSPTHCSAQAELLRSIGAQGHKDDLPLLLAFLRQKDDAQIDGEQAGGNDYNALKTNIVRSGAMAGLSLLHDDGGAHVSYTYLSSRLGRSVMMYARNRRKLRRDSTFTFIFIDIQTRRGNILSASPPLKPLHRQPLMWKTNHCVKRYLLTYVCGFKVDCGKQIQAHACVCIHREACFRDACIIKHTKAYSLSNSHVFTAKYKHFHE